MMVSRCVLDACALAAIFEKEQGSEVVLDILLKAKEGKMDVFMNKLNFFEVYYVTLRRKGLDAAEEFLTTSLDMPIVIIDGMTDELMREAGRFKTSYKMSLADAIALGQASVLDASLVTADRHELEAVENGESIDFTWIR
ncbi:MAG: type II toxin-antitoxin system VapC family toxin [Defluviitaleaceae bacterium]|nr:type II toxin-antitoxin system VapC family toxin [Defluviitaleaceae bacterium]